VRLEPYIKEIPKLKPLDELIWAYNELKADAVKLHRWFRRTSQKKRTRRKALYITATVLIIVLAFGLIASLASADEQKEQYLRTQKTLESVQLKADKAKQAELLLQQQLQKEVELKQQIEQLNSELQAKAQSKTTGGYGAVDTNFGWGNSYDYGYCTWYVANRVKTPNDLGNANTWDDRARGHGFTVTTIPKVGSIAQSDAGYLGHVAYVEQVVDGQVYISEMNGVAGWNKVGYRWMPIGSFVYIYLWSPIYDPLI